MDDAMRPFELVEPRTLDEACAVLGDDHARPVAGGTALLTLIKQGLYVPRTLVNLRKIPNAGCIDYDPQNGLRIGALATISEVESSSVVREHYPVLAEACHVVANIRIRNMATIGGNLAHGDHQSDPPTVLAALDAELELIKKGGQRRMKIADFLLGSYETALQPGELISALFLPSPPAGLSGVYLKFTTGSSEERPCIGIAALARIEEGTCRELRLAVGAVSPRPLRMHPSEAMARDRTLTAELLDRIAVETAQSVEPIDDVRGPASYKRHLTQVLTRRAVAACTASKEAEQRR
jgi:carbon-monoxide dehydrogenase medium subunit